MKESITSDFLKDLLQAALGLHVFCLPEDYEDDSPDFSLRRILFPESNWEESFSRHFMELDQKSVYCLSDAFKSQYFIMNLPDMEDENAHCLVAGPFLIEEANDLFCTEVIEQNHLNDSALSALKCYFQNLPVVDPSSVAASFNVLASRLWHSGRDLQVEYIMEIPPKELVDWDHLADSNHIFSAHMLEKRYEAENAFLGAVMRGDQQEALQCYERFSSFKIAPRYQDPLRDSKNLSIVLNTLLRKAVEQSHVHPYYLDEISHHFALKIEAAVSSSQMDGIHLEMIHKYCLLVKNQSLESYTPLIREIINYIEFNLSNQLNLKEISTRFNVNPSYLSSTFRKEVGVTLTDYVNGLRVRAALKLLNTSNIQIQDISYYVGIDDVNYFSRVFKKKVGYTPTDYRRMMRQVV